ncbi:FAD-dependent oxidoreductase [Streptomyces sp. NPDC058001]|uniref:FAD-dependent oxidoreductase n=1 Tax=Streptomyces sp. NPDC058001 TaxID=3346300 RepID=UPI0036E09F7E
MEETRTEVLIVGGGLGGVAAALTAARLGRTVVLTEPTDWLGGQLTAQAVPPDEHPWIEGPAAPPGYAELRRRVRDYYRRNYPLRHADDPLLDPGLGVVSRMCHEPRVSAAVLEEMLAPWRSAGTVRVLTRHRPVAVHAGGDRIEAVTLQDLDTGAELTVSASYTVDATELGDLLELGGIEHVIGAEGRDTTGEPHAPDTADPLDQQAISWCFALEHRPGEDHVVDRPAAYEEWKNRTAPFWPGSQLSWTDVVPITLKQRTWRLMDADREAGEHFDLFQFRRIRAREQFAEGAYDTDLTVVNWPQIDYWERPILGVPEADAEAALLATRELSLSFLHWMQTEAPRPDGGTGYPGLRLRPDVTGTSDGLAKTPYIRESRRIQAEFTVLEQHVGVEARPPGSGSEIFHDSVGLGSYRIDLHPSTAGRTYVDIEAYPFQIPLGALIPVRVDNLLPANKNIGTTHITNGCYRLHPVEWAIGEAVGALAAYCLDHDLPPRKVRSDQQELADYQRLLSQNLGIGLTWPEEVRTHRHT